MHSPFARRLSLVTFALAAAGGAWAVAGAREHSVPPPAPIIAVLDLEEALSGLAEKRDKEAALKTQFDNLKKNVDKLDDDFKSEEERLKQEPEGPKRMEMAKSAREKVIRLEFEKQYSQRLLDESRADMIRDLYLKVSAASAEMAKSNGYSMVLASDERAQIPAKDPEAMMRSITLKRMLYIDKTMDITAELVQKMNNDYAAGAKAPATPPPAKGGAAPARPAGAKK